MRSPTARARRSPIRTFFSELREHVLPRLADVSVRAGVDRRLRRRRRRLRAGDSLQGGGGRAPRPDLRDRRGRARDRAGPGREASPRTTWRSSKRATPPPAERGSFEDYVETIGRRAGLPREPAREHRLRAAQHRGRRLVQRVSPGRHAPRALAIQSLARVPRAQGRLRELGPPRDPGSGRAGVAALQPAPARFPAARRIPSASTAAFAEPIAVEVDDDAAGEQSTRPRTLVALARARSAGTDATRWSNATPTVVGPRWATARLLHRADAIAAALRARGFAAGDRDRADVAEPRRIGSSRTSESSSRAA